MVKWQLFMSPFEGAYKGKQKHHKDTSEDDGSFEILAPSNWYFWVFIWVTRGAWLHLIIRKNKEHLVAINMSAIQRCIYLFLWEPRLPQFFFCHAEIFKSGYFMQIYSNQSVLCRNIGQVPLRVTQSCAADYLDRTWMQCLFFFRFHWSIKMGQNQCIV